MLKYKVKKLLVVGNLARDIINGKDYFGGSAGAIALNSKFLGLETAILSVIGKDHFSEKYLDLFSYKKIDVSHVQRVLNEMAVCQVLNKVNRNSSRKWTDNGSSQQMENLELDRSWLLQFDMIHLVSCPPRLIVKLVRVLKETDIPISYEPGPRIIQSSDFANIKIIRMVKLIFGNREEIDTLLKYLKLKKPSDILGLGPSIIVVTKGRQ